MEEFKSVFMESKTSNNTHKGAGEEEQGIKERKDQRKVQNRETRNDSHKCMEKVNKRESRNKKERLPSLLRPWKMSEEMVDREFEQRSNDRGANLK